MEGTIAVEDLLIPVEHRDGAWYVDDPRRGLLRWLEEQGVIDQGGKLLHPEQYGLVESET